MFLRPKTRKRDSKVPRYWRVGQSRRAADERVVQRRVPYLGEINNGQKAAWTRAIEVFAEDGEARQAALFRDDRVAPESDLAVVPIRFSRLLAPTPRAGSYPRKPSVSAAFIGRGTPCQGRGLHRAFPFFSKYRWW